MPTSTMLEKHMAMVSDDLPAGISFENVRRVTFEWGEELDDRGPYELVIELFAGRKLKVESQK